jgi:hypothetical protein
MFTNFKLGYEIPRRSKCRSFPGSACFSLGERDFSAAEHRMLKNLKETIDVLEADLP